MKMEKSLPIPSRVSEFLEVIESHDDVAVKGTLKCSCGCYKFAIIYHGKKGKKFFSPNIVKIKSENGKKVVLMAKCNECQKEILIYDSSIDGYKNYKNNEVSFMGEYNIFVCEDCEENNMYIDIAYNSYGKEFLVKKNKLNWEEYFLDIFVYGKCASCNKDYKGLLEESC